MAFYQSMASPNIKFESCLGKGSFSSVYKAKLIDVNEVVAIKCIHNSIASILDCANVAGEIAMLRTLNHPNILSLKSYTISKSFSFIFITTEYASYKTLKHYHIHEYPMKELVIKNIMIQLFSSLDYIHQLGIYHGDIKPDNILCTTVSENGPYIKLADFGLSNIIVKGGRSCYGGGSFYYMAPEVMLGLQTDVTCDLWSAGVVLHFLLFNRKLFNAPDKNSFRSYIKKQMLPSFAMVHSYSDQCVGLVKGLLKYNPSQRLMGKSLREHPFLNFVDPVIDRESFLIRGQNSILKAIESFDNKSYYDSLIEAHEGILQLKIYHNLINDEKKQLELCKKIGEYGYFVDKVQKTLVQVCNSCPEDCNDVEFRKYLMSSPKLLEGFDIGCNAEIFFKSGQKKEALDNFHLAVGTLLPLMKEEPRSPRKSVLGKKISEWISFIQYLSKPADTQTEK